MERTLRRCAIALANLLLAGVGDGAARIDRSDRVIHVRRPLTAAEEAMLPAGLVAIDGAGGAGFLDLLAKGSTR